MKDLYILGGGTFSYIRNHLALSAPAFGETAKKLKVLCDKKFTELETNLLLTRMADPLSPMVTNSDVEGVMAKIKANNDTKVVFFNVAMCDYRGYIRDDSGTLTESGKYNKRLHTNEGPQNLVMIPEPKIIRTLREGRKDIFLVAFKTTCGASEQEQYLAGLNLLKKNSCNLVLANDTLTHRNMIITPEEAKYHVTMNRDKALEKLVDMTWKRSQLTFTRSTVIDGELVPWYSDKVYNSLRTVVNHCIVNGAYKPFNGATVGHFACKISDNEFLTSVRKSNFNDLFDNGLVKITTDGPDSVIAYGKKPSVGGQSQRIVFSDHPEYDCIVHFHCPIKAGSRVPIISQEEYECGSHECGQNTSNGLRVFGNLKTQEEFSAVMLDNHGPNIVFHHSIDPQTIIQFIENNFDLSLKTGGPVN